MRSVADELRGRDIERVLQLPVNERVALALSLGDEDLDLYVRSSGLTTAAALSRLRASRSRGRRTSHSAHVDPR